MDPPKSYNARKKERQERLAAAENKIDETYEQSISWQNLIYDDSETQDAQTVKSQRRYNPEKGRVSSVQDHLASMNGKEPVWNVTEENSDFDSTEISPESEYTPKSKAHFPRLSPELRKLILIIRLAAASVMFAAAILLGSLSNLTIPLLVLAACLAVIDLVIEAVRDLVSGIFYENCTVVVFVTVVTAVVGFLQEAAAFIILYRISELLCNTLKEVVSHSAIQQVSFRETEIRDLLSERFQEEGIDYLSVEGIMHHTANSVLVPVIFLAVLYAVLLPVFTYYRVPVAIHRAVILIFLATPVSLITAMQVIGRNGLCAAASLGLVFRNAKTIEALENTRMVVFDKSGIFDPPPAEVRSAISPRFDYDTLMNLVFHLVYESEQRFAETIRNSVTFSYDPDLITGIEETAGGVRGEINGTEVLFGTRSYLSAHELIPPESEHEPDTVSYFLFLAGQYAGEVCVTSDLYGDISDIIHELRIDGVNKCILITQESAEEIARFAEVNGFDEVYAGIAPEDKDSLLRELFTGTRDYSILLTSDPSLYGYYGSTVILAGEKLGQADAVIQPHLFAGLAGILMVSKRIRQLATENAMTAFAVKGFLIFLSLIGYCNLWMAVIGETAAVVFTIFNAKRVASKSLLQTFIDK